MLLYFFAVVGSTLILVEQQYVTARSQDTVGLVIGLNIHRDSEQGSCTVSYLLNEMAVLLGLFAMICAWNLRRLRPKKIFSRQVVLNVAWHDPNRTGIQESTHVQSVTCGQSSEGYMRDHYLKEPDSKFSQS